MCRANTVGQGSLEICDGFSVAVLAAVSRYPQKLWVLTDVLRALYPSSTSWKARQKFKAAMEEISGMHSRIWPQLDVPGMVTADDSGALGIPTSLFFATIPWAFSSPKRTQAARTLSAKWIHSLVGFMAEHLSQSERLKLLLFEADGTCYWHNGLLGRDGSVMCFTQSMKSAITLFWVADLLDTSKPWISRPLDSNNLADFLLWGLDPVPAKVKNNELKQTKQRILLSVLVAFRQLAHWYDAHVLDGQAVLEHVPEGNNNKRRRLTVFTVRTIAAKAGMLLLNGTVSRSNLLSPKCKHTSLFVFPAQTCATQVRWASQALEKASARCKVSVTQLAYRMCATRRQ